jgi:hypothetical protein
MVIISSRCDKVEVEFLYLSVGWCKREIQLWLTKVTGAYSN